ncbi:hypothetical protein AACH10_05190 [Ideonella sp. DXS22W]|uniref:Copper-binding protein n=1 Tax=Pseudaquabacterium inlustre TaxID=2984192 RepID=A0ABU9CGK2_9BURK
MTRRTLGTTLAALALAGPLAAQAAMVAGPGGTAEQGRRMVFDTPPSASAASAPALDLAEGRLDAVDLAAGRVVINGRPVALHPQGLRVIGGAGQALAGPAALVAGQRVRFALEPGTAAQRRIVLIFIER